MTGIAILAPGYPHAPGGVTDHTARLVAHWTAFGRTVEVAGGGGGVDDRVAGWRERGVRSLLIQYVPFLYGRRGLSRLPERLARKARAAGVRVTTFVHEPWVPPTRVSWLVLHPLQRRQLLRLLRWSDAAVTPVPAWRPLLGGSATLIPVGSTLGDPPPAPPTPPAPYDAPVVFSPFAAGLNWGWITAAVNAIAAPRGLVVIGGSAREAAAHHAVRRWADPAWEWRGRLPAAAALTELTRARLVLAPFIDGLSARRTSALAALSVGARVLTTTGPLFDPVFDTGPVRAASGRAGFADAAATIWPEPDTPQQRASRRSWYAAHFEAKRIDRDLLAIVSGVAGGPAGVGPEPQGHILDRP